MPDVTELLMQDHREVEALFKEYETGHSGATLQRICEELQVHTSLEEEMVYPQLARFQRRHAEHAEEEHQQAKELMAEIRACGVDSQDARQLAQRLHVAIRTHVTNEEGEWLPELRAQMPEQLDELGTRLSARKAEIKKARAVVG